MRLLLALERRPESWEVGSGGRWEEAYAEERIGVDAEEVVLWPRDPRGGPRERREGVDAAIE